MQNMESLLSTLLYQQVRDVLVQGHIFLNCSLTESFCIAVVEAACAGLFVVSTNVGGVTEVLPGNLPPAARANTADQARAAAGGGCTGSARGGSGGGPRSRRTPPAFASFAAPTVAALSAAVSAAIPLALALDPAAVHGQVRLMYSWPDVAKRTEAVYDAVSRKGQLRSSADDARGGGAPAMGPRPRAEREADARVGAHAVGAFDAADGGGSRSRCSLAQRCLRYCSCGPVAGLLGCVVACLLAAFAVLLEWTHPATAIERAPDWGPAGMPVGRGSFASPYDDYEDNAWSDDSNSEDDCRAGSEGGGGEDEEGETETEGVSENEDRRANDDEGRVHAPESHLKTTTEAKASTV
jgi:phosphatidylinositol glycan class A protein